MTKQKNTKRALLASVLSMMLCMTMLVGSTFAWFTDSVTSGKNKIVAGNLDVELYAKDAAGKYNPVTADTNLFMEDALWEPGHVEVINLKVANLGTLALKYQFGINIASEKGSVNVSGEEFKLSDYIKFAVIDGEQSYENRDAAIAAANTSAVALSALAVNENGVLYPAAKATTEKPAERLLTLVAYMPTTVGNEANYKTADDVKAPEIELGVNLVATQTPYEEDSFSNDYDKDPVKLLSVVNQASLEEALTEIYNLSDAKAKIVLDDNVTVTNKTFNINDGKDITIDLAGHDLTVTNTGNTDGFIIQNAGLTMTDSKNTGTFTFSSDNSNSVPFVTVDEDTTADTALTFENIRINASNISNGIIYAEGNNAAKIDINFNAGADFNMTMNSTQYIGGASVVRAEYANVNVNEGANLAIGMNTEYHNPSIVAIDVQHSNVAISGGNITVSYSNSSMNGLAAAVGLDMGSTANITGGVITLTGNKSLFGVYIGEGIVNMSGGIINVNAQNSKTEADAFYIDNRYKHAEVNMNGGTINMNASFTNEKNGYAFEFKGNVPSFADAKVTVSGSAEINLKNDENTGMRNAICNYTNDSRFVDER